MPTEGLTLTIGSVRFNRSADYPQMNDVADQLLDNLNAAAQKLGVYNRYIDMNHAK
ncbi:hypothetical protein AAE478_000685, partial [Parahypoxylon ruwenzoriense]